MDKSDSVAILGATSGVGKALARRLQNECKQLMLVARDESKLQAVVNDITARGATAESIVADFNNIDGHEALLEKIADCGVVMVVYGSLPDQQLCQQEWQASEQALLTNFISAVSILNRVANVFEERQHGQIVVVSSVAGDRGRQSNYLYGAAKGGLTIFVDGLRNRLASKGVHVLNVKPGFIDTPMTANIEKKPAVLWVGPERVADDIVKACKGKNNTIYTPWFWRYILLIIKHIPEPIFKKLSL